MINRKGTCSDVSMPVCRNVIENEIIIIVPERHLCVEYDSPNLIACHRIRQSPLSRLDTHLTLHVQFLKTEY